MDEKVETSHLSVSDWFRPLSQEADVRTISVKVLAKTRKRIIEIYAASCVVIDDYDKVRNSEEQIEELKKVKTKMAKDALCSRIEDLRGKRTGLKAQKGYFFVEDIWTIGGKQNANGNN